MARQIMFVQAISEALREEMTRDSNIILMGEDIRHALMGVTAGLVDVFGKERVLDMPISEAGWNGMALGAAMAGLRPVMEYQITPFPFLAMDQLVDQILKIRYMTGGQTKVPLVVRAPIGAPSGMAGQHSDSTYSVLLNYGAKAVVPSTPYDAKGLLKTAIREDDPVFFFESMRLMGLRGEVPEGEYTIPLGKADVKRKGSDVTIVAVGYLVHEAISAANELSKSSGIECEVVDVRSLHPLDEETILQSVSKTGRVVVADDANRTCGFSAEIAALIADKAFDSLKAPVRRVTRGGYVVPFARTMEAAVFPDASAIRDTVTNLPGIAISTATRR